MYEDRTYEAIMSDILARVSEADGDIDTREGSIIWTAAAPVAAELAQAYIAIDGMLLECFADTQSKENLIRKAAERGLYIREATKAIRRAVFDAPVSVGDRFSRGGLTYKVCGFASDGAAKLECETAGKAGNSDFGALTPVEYIQGLTSAVLCEVLAAGQDGEDTESFRKRYFDNMKEQSFGGNTADYKEKAANINGVGGARVYPAWQGGGTVRLCIIGAEGKSPSEEMVSAVQELFDPKASQGDGTGLAPIGHKVTVTGAAEKTINASAKLLLREGWLIEDVEPLASEALNGYFTSLRDSWSGGDNLMVRLSRIEVALLSLEGVKDVLELKIDGAAANLRLDGDEIPVLGAVTVYE